MMALRGCNEVRNYVSSLLLRLLKVSSILIRNQNMFHRARFNIEDEK